MLAQNEVRSTHRVGFTLLEVMIAAAILGIGCLGILAMLSTAQENNDISEFRTRGTVIGEQFISNLEAEARNATPVAGQANQYNMPNGTAIATIAKSAVGKWAVYGRINQIGQRADGGDGTAASNLPFKYCLGYFSRNEEHSSLQTGAIRVYWRRDNQAMTSNDECKKELLENMDTLANSKGTDTKKYEFVTLPFSISLSAVHSDTVISDEHS